LFNTTGNESEFHRRWRLLSSTWRRDYRTSCGREHLNFRIANIETFPVAITDNFGAPDQFGWGQIFVNHNLLQAMDDCHQFDTVGSVPGCLSM